MPGFLRHFLPSSRMGMVHATVLAIVVALGVGLRLNNIADESVYWDEFSSLIHLRPPAGYQDSPYCTQWDQTVIRKESQSLWEFWSANRELDPATMPLYYTFEYFVWNYGRQSVLAIRLLSVLFSLAAFPCIYLLGRFLWGATGGIVALFMFAASPVHVQFAQEIRMYSMFAAFAAASALTFYLVVERGGRWWIPHLIVNLLLLWTHPFAVWLPFTEGIFLILIYWRRWKFVLAWGFSHVLLLVPSAIYVANIRFFGRETTDSWMVIPGARAIFADLLADDCVGMTSQLWGRPDALIRFFGEETGTALADAKFTLGIWCAVFVVLLCLLCVALAALRLVLARRAGEGDNRLNWAIFLVLWAVLPLLILFTLSHLWRPMLMPRYTMHSSLAFYLLAGGGIALIVPRWLRVLPSLLLVLMYAYQQCLVLDGPHRTDWRGAAQYLKENADDDDFILVENWLWKRVFTYSMGPVPQVITHGTKVDTVAELARTWLDGAYPRDPENPEPRALWIVFNNNYFNMAPAFELEQELARRNMQWRSTYFKGIEGLWIYEVADYMGLPWRVPADWKPADTLDDDFQDASMAFNRYNEFDNAICFAEQGLSLVPDSPRLYSYIGLNMRAKKEFRAAQHALEHAVKLAPTEYPWTLINLGECDLALGEPERAVEPLRLAVETLPFDLHARALLAQALIESGNPWEAMNMLDIDYRNQAFVADQESTHWDMVKWAAQEIAAAEGHAQ